MDIWETAIQAGPYAIAILESVVVVVLWRTCRADRAQHRNDFTQIHKNIQALNELKAKELSDLRKELTQHADIEVEKLHTHYNEILSRKDGVIEQIQSDYNARMQDLLVSQTKSTENFSFGIEQLTNIFGARMDEVARLLTQTPVRYMDPKRGTINDEKNH